jgi:sulfoquinovosyltransferase
MKNNCCFVLQFLLISQAIFNARSFTLRGLSMKYEARQHHHAIIPPLSTLPPLRILLIVEPTPFNYVSGYANRFKETLRFLSKCGDTVEVITSDPDPQAPKTFLNFNVNTFSGVSFPLYPQVSVSFDLRARIKKIAQSFKPDVIHVSAPSAVLIAAVIWAKALSIPLVMSYHTDFVGYARSYVPLPGSVQLAHFLVRNFLQMADLVLCTSPQLKQEMEKIGLNRVDVWQKGINTEVSLYLLFISYLYITVCV